MSNDKYNRPITDRSGNTATVDVYDVLKAFDVRCPALQHLIKKALCAGVRGHKTTMQDMQDIVDSANRALELAKHLSLSQKEEALVRIINSEENTK